MANNWDEFFATPIKASKKLHVTAKDVKRGAQIDARRREAERLVAEQSKTTPTGLPYGITPRPSGVPSDAPRMYEGELAKSAPSDLISNALLAGNLGGVSAAFGALAPLRTGLAVGAGADAVLGAKAGEGDIPAVLSGAGMLGRRALPVALATGAAYAADADAMPVAKYLRGSLPTSIHGKGWFYNHANDTLVGIPPGDLGPHGDHDGWIGIAKNAKMLGIDPKLSKIVQRQYGFFLPRDITKIAMELGWEPHLERGRGFYTPGQEFSISDEANTFLDDYYKKIHGISPGEGWLVGAELYDTLTRVRAWPGRKGSPYISGLSFTEKPVTPSQFRNIWDDIGPELQVDKASTFNMHDDAGGLLTLPISEALTAKRWPINKAAGGSVKKMLQGVYRGYAGERRPTIGALGSEMYFTSPQKRVADYYATRRAAETGEAPHVDMLMVDPFNTKYQSYSLGLPADKYNPSRDGVVTRARRVDPEEVVDVHQLYAGGGLVKSGLKMMFPNLGAPLHVVKPKGGNWLSGSVEDALRGLKKNTFPIDHPLPDEVTRLRQVPGEDGTTLFQDPLRGNVFTPEQVANTNAISTRQGTLNSWIEGPLTKYVKTRMASPDDEVRRLAEEGVLHFEPQGIRDVSPIMNEIYGRRITAGFPGEEMAKTPLGQQWERYADAGIKNFEARDLSSAERASSFGGRSDIPPGTTVHDINSHWLGGPMAQENLGFDHLVDELSNALDPNSGLPRHLQLTPEAVKNLSMEKAVRRVADINAWRAAKKVEANRALAEQASIVREYAHSPEKPNPKGLRWVELKQQDVDPTMYTLREAKFADGSPHYEYVDKTGEPVAAAGRTIEEAAKNLKDTKGEAALQQQLRYEGDTMGHCVGGYCDDVISGRSRIFSLRDAKGEPHVTVEVGLQPRNIGQQDIPNNYIDEAMEKLGIDSPESQWGREEEIDRLAGDLWRKDNPDVQRIVQIKGKQNRKPNDEYLPFVQDFVKNPPHGQPWDEVGDLQNTGLRRTIDAFNSNELKKIQEAGIEVPTHATPEEIEAINRQIWPDPDVRAGAHPEGFASGGSVGGPAAGWELFTAPTGSPEENKLSWDIFSGHNDAEQLEALE